MKINGEEYNTIEYAAKYFNVKASKTVSEWIQKKIISQPPTITYGLRTIRIFPEEYLKKAKKELEEYLKKKSKKK